MDKLFKAYYKSPIGYIKIYCDNNAILSLNFVDTINNDTCLNTISNRCMKKLHEYFKGTRQSFDIPVSLNGTLFQKKVWNELIKIPYGTTVPYKYIAEKIGGISFSRAVGNANNKNKISIIIPCHRVIGCNKKLTGYAGGLWRKKWLLDHESKFL